MVQRTTPFRQLWHIRPVLIFKMVPHFVDQRSRPGNQQGLSRSGGQCGQGECRQNCASPNSNHCAGRRHLHNSSMKHRENCETTRLPITARAPRPDIQPTAHHATRCDQTVPAEILKDLSIRGTVQGHCWLRVHVSYRRPPDSPFTHSRDTAYSRTSFSLQINWLTRPLRFANGMRGSVDWLRIPVRQRSLTSA